MAQTFDRWQCAAFQDISEATEHIERWRWTKASPLMRVRFAIGTGRDDTMRGLNRSYRNIDRSTDVLAFAMREGQPLPAVDDGPEMLGDVVISVDTARRQARRRRRRLLDELTTLLAHGLLHLVGHDHVTRGDERTMKRLTGELEQAATRRSG